MNYRFDLCDFVQTMDPLQVAPVTISVPHDTLHMAECDLDLPMRKIGVVARDLAVSTIAKNIAALTPIQLVRGLMWRGYLDYNRAAKDACDHPGMVMYWQAYRAAVTRRVKSSSRASASLFLDLHGFSNQPPYGEFDLILGTCNRSTVNGDVDLRLGEYLRQHGYLVFVPAETELIAGVPDLLRGGDTVRSVFHETGVDAVQVEVGRRFRTRDSLEEGRQLARHLAGFIADWTKSAG